MKCQSGKDLYDLRIFPLDHKSLFHDSDECPVGIRPRGSFKTILLIHFRITKERSLYIGIYDALKQILLFIVYEKNTKKVQKALIRCYRFSGLSRLPRTKRHFEGESSRVFVPLGSYSVHKGERLQVSFHAVFPSLFTRYQKNLINC